MDLDVNFIGNLRRVCAPDKASLSFIFTNLANTNLNH